MENNDFKNGKWAKKIISMQGEDGSWGDFHSLSMASLKAHRITTEQALRRLEILGFSIEDACIQRAVGYLDDCLTGRKNIPDREEKSCDWKVFRDLMLACWIKRFTDENNAANKVASSWANVITAAFSSGKYSQKAYTEAYFKVFGKIPRGGRLLDFVNFYQLSLLRGALDETTESLMIDYVLAHKEGIYYIYESCVSMPPEKFQGRICSRYLSAVELLCRYQKSAHKLAFVADRLEEHRLENGAWDLGADTKDGVYFPLSDRWDTASRISDCTFRIEKIIQSIRRE